MDTITGIEVELGDGNAFAVLGVVMRAMRRAKVDQTIIDAYEADAMSGDYDHLLQTTMRYVEVI